MRSLLRPTPLVCALLLGALAAAPAAAQTSTSPAAAPPTPDAEVASAAEDEGGKVYQLSARTWAIYVPDFVLDAFFATHPNMWSGGVANLAYGAEFTIRDPDSYDLVIGLDWASLRTPDDWWLEDGDPLVDADWGEQNLSLLQLDVAIQWTHGLNPTETVQLYGGFGVGIAAVLGRFDKTDVHPGCGALLSGSDDVALLDECFDADGEPLLLGGPEREEDIPPVLPVLSASFGTRFFLTEQVALSVELGLKTAYLYGGLELGYVF